MSTLKTKIADIEINNPLIAASGTVGYGREFSKLVSLSEFGAIATKGTTINPKMGNPSPRIAETPAGMLNSVGLENPGIEHFIQNELTWLSKQNTKIIANIAGSTVNDYECLAEKLNETAIDFIELNISCPNVNENGKNFGSNPQTAFDVVKKTRVKTSKKLIVKLTPNTTSIIETAKAVETAGADAILLINTIFATRINIETRRPMLKNNFGGLSGPAIFPIALGMVWQVFNSVKIPIVGCGGISCAKHALEMIMAGACALEIGTILFSKPNAIVEIKNELIEWLNLHHVKNINELVGSVKPWTD